MSNKDEALNSVRNALVFCFPNDLDRVHEIMKAINEALAQPAQEPVAWMNDQTPSGIFARHKDGAKNFGCDIPLYATPSQRPWVGLTDREIFDLYHEFADFLESADLEYERAIEAKLKEKNT